MSDDMLIAVHTFPMLTSILVEEILLPRYMNWSTYVRDMVFNVNMVPSCLKHVNSVLFDFT